MTVETLRQVPLFESLDDEAAKKLCELLESLDCKANTFLFRAGATVALMAFRGRETVVWSQNTQRVANRVPRQAVQPGLTAQFGIDRFPPLAIFDEPNLGNQTSRRTSTIVSQSPQPV